MTKFTDITKILFLGAAMIIGTATIGTEIVGTPAYAEGDEIDCDLDGYTITDECIGDVFGYPGFPTADKGDEDTCSVWENDVWDAADTYFYYNGSFPVWFSYWQSHNFSFHGYTGSEIPMSWYGVNLIAIEDDRCPG